MRDYPNVILIIVDTLRKDYAKPLEEELKKLGFISYENAIAPAPWTTPSHASIFTGLYPVLHGAHETKDRKILRVKLKKNNSILSLQLKNLGYETYLYSANTLISPEFGFIGFDHVFSTLHVPSLISNLSSREKEFIEELMKKASTKSAQVKELIFLKKYKLLVKLGVNYFLRKPIFYAYAMLRKWPIDKGANILLKKLKNLLAATSRDEPKFIVINLMEVHEPYSIDEVDITRKHIENLKTNVLDLNLVKRWRKNYPKEVAYVTRKILEIMRILKEREIFDNSLIIVTSDHGQLLGEYGRIEHGVFLYDELLRVPLLIKYPEDLEIHLIKDQNKSRCRYVSLTRLKPFILSLIDNRLENDSFLYSDTVFSESYGIHIVIGELTSEEERKNIDRLEKYRIAIYYKNFKGIFNVTEWKFEEIISYNPKVKVTEDVIKDMKSKIVKFLKTATLTTTLKSKL